MGQARTTEVGVALITRQQEQWLADLTEDLDLHRYPTRMQLMRAVDDAARRAESLARLEYALSRRR